MAADVYGVYPHVGRGGWTWYTGSAGWMYQLITESFLGLRKEGNTLFIEPCVPDEWKSFKIEYKFGTATYHIEVLLSSNELSISVDGQKQPSESISLVDDGNDHVVQVSDT